MTDADLAAIEARWRQVANHAWSRHSGALELPEIGGWPIVRAHLADMERLYDDAVGVLALVAEVRKLRELIAKYVWRDGPPPEPGDWWLDIPNMTDGPVVDYQSLKMVNYAKCAGSRHAAVLTPDEAAAALLDEKPRQP